MRAVWTPGFFRWGSPSEVSAAIRRVADPQGTLFPESQAPPDSAFAASEQRPSVCTETASLGITTRSFPRHCCQGQTTIRQECGAACATRLPAGFEVRRFVRVLSLESALLTKRPMTGALPLPVDLPSPCLRRRIRSLLLGSCDPNQSSAGRLPCRRVRSVQRSCDRLNPVGSLLTHSRVRARPEAAPVVPVLPG